MKLTGRNIAAIVIAVLLMTLIAHYDDLLPYRWQTFNAKDGSFSAQFPSKPEVKEEQVQLGARGTTTLYLITASPAKNTVYLCSYFEDPRLEHGAAEDALDSSRDGGISNIQGTLVSERHLEVGGYPAREVDARARGDSLVTMRLVAAGHRMFFLMTVENDRQRSDSKNVRRFFESLKFSGK